MMNKCELKRTYGVLQEIKQAQSPAGASMLSLKLEVPPATLGRLLQHLEFQGYLEKVSNKGRVLTPAGQDYINSLRSQILALENTEGLRKLAMSPDKQTMLDMLYARKALEVESIGAACQKITPEQLAELTRIVALQDREKAANRIGERQDLQFHLMLAKISGNTCIQQILSLILMRDDAYVRLSIIAKFLSSKGMPHSISHHRIIEALRERDEELAKKLLAEHISFYIEYVEKSS